MFSVPRTDELADFTVDNVVGQDWPDRLRQAFVLQRIGEAAAPIQDIGLIPCSLIVIICLIYL